TYGEAFTVQPFGNSMVTLTLTPQQVKDTLEQQFAGCLGQTVNRVLQISNGFHFTWDNTQPACQKVRDVTLTTASGTETIVQNGAVVGTGPYRIAVNNFLATGGDGFTALTGGTNALGGAQDIDALVAYLAGFKSPNPPYDPTNVALNKPRIVRLDPGATCP